jgi:hypothetical protein
MPLVLFLSVSLACAAQLQTSRTAHLLPPSSLRCANQNEPLAVPDAQPELSWSLRASSPASHAVRQSAYQVEVAATDAELAAGKNIVWDSTRVESAASSGVVYQGAPLAPGRTYAWQVRVWDEQGIASGWSAIAHWMQAPAWPAAWIAAPARDSDQATDPMPLFRRAFTVARPIARAVLYASGLGQDELRINGRTVGGSELTPGWSDYRKTVFYDSYDVTGLLKTGPNALGVMLGNGMYRVFKTPGRYTKFEGSYGWPMCTVALRITFADGTSMKIETDDAWKTHPGPITFSSTYGGEDFDAREEPRGWDGVAFDDAGWRAAVVVDGPGGAMRPELAPPIRVMHTYAPIKWTEPKPGILVCDLGQNFAGWPAITVAGPAGARVKLTPGELLKSDGTVSQRSSGGPQWFAYTLRGGSAEQWHPRFSYYGFRYVQVEGAARTVAPGTAHLLDLRGEAVHSSSRNIGAFASSDETLNRIHQLILHAIENNAVSLFTDCPHREKLGWLEEAHLLAPSMLYDFDFAGLYAATAQNIADAQQQDGAKAGMVPEIAPQFVVFDPPFNDSPEWGSAAVLAPWYVYERDGDLHALAARLDVMRRYVAYLATRAQDGIIAYGLGDWYDIGPGSPGFSKLTTAGLTATAIDYQDLRVLEKATALLGLSSDSENYRRQAESVRKPFNERFLNAAAHRYDKGSQTAQAMPLVLGLVPDNERKAVLDALVKDIRAHGNHVTAGDVGYHYVVDALLDGGRSDVLLDMLERTDTPSYGYQLAQGATSLTEAWDANPESSQDHFMLGDAEEWFYRGLGGIEINQSAQGAERLVLRPWVMPHAGWVRTRYESALGPIESDWKRGTQETEYDFTIPVNTSASIVLETASPASATLDGTPLSKAGDVIAARLGAAEVKFTLGSGSYHLRAANPLPAGRLEAQP